MEQIANGTAVTNCTLHVSNLPLDLEKDGVKSIFHEYGNVTGVILIRGKNNTNQAYISYSSYAEAECAIDELNEKLPLMLYVQFKDRNLKRNKINIDVDLSKPINDFRYKDNPVDSMQNTRQAIDMGKPNCSPAFSYKAYTTDDELLYNVPNDSTTFNPYENEGPYHDTNLLYTRGRLQLSRDGRRHISFGRGCTYYNLPEPHYKVASYIQNVYEKREKGFYEYNTSDVEVDAGNCKICLEPTAYRCQRCQSTFYCSKICQISDWPKHKFECQPIPPLVRVPINMTPMSNLSEIKISEDFRELKPKTLRRPRSQNFPAEVSNEPLASQISLDKKIQYQSKNQDVQENVEPKGATQSEQEKFKDPLSVTLWRDGDKEFIPKDTFIAVIITTLLNDNECLVHRVDASNETNELYASLKDYVETQTLVEPQENVLCILKHENLWYRVTIISYRKNKESHVYYHDFGTYGNVVVDKVCPIKNFKHIPCLARRIRFVKGVNAFTKIQEGNVVSVKAIEVIDDIIHVEVQPLQIKNSSNSDIVDQMNKCNITDNSLATNNATEQKNDEDLAIENIAKFPSVLEQLKVGDSGIIILHAKLSQSEYNVTLVPEHFMAEFNSLLGEMKEHCLDQLAKNPNFSPKVGDLICGQNMEAKEWFRGVVLATKPVIKLAVIDESRIFVPIQCTLISEKYKNICSLGLVSQFPANAKMPDTKLEYGNFKVVEIIDKSKAMIQISNDNSVHIKNVSLQKWIPKLEQKGIECAPLKSGNKVTIVHFFSQKLMYVVNREPEQKEIAHKLEQNIAKYALNKIPLAETPVVGQIVMAHYSADKNYYRAIVTKVKDNKILVKYIDYGNEEITTVDKLFILPDDLKKHPSCVTKIRLRNVKHDVPLTEAATKYFQELIAESAELICTFDGHPFDDGVNLMTLQNDNVNLNMNNFITPTWEKNDITNNIDKKNFDINDLPMLKLGDIGEEVEAIVLSFFPESCEFVLGPNDEVTVKAIQEEMLERIAKYVEKTTDHYIPRDSELCIAKYKGMFYRAVCVDSSASPTSSRVFFIDYGNAACVEHSDIRAFAEDFASIGAYGIFCNITPIVPKNKITEALSQRIKELTPIYEMIKLKIISIDNSDKSPSIDIPAIREKLIQEKLI